MLQQQRHEKIVNFISEHGFLSVDDAVKQFDASPATIRRDFEELARGNLVQRVRGGVRNIKQDPIGMVPFEVREIQYSKEKEVLAQAAAKLLEPGDVVFVDGGTTTFHLEMCLPDFGLRVITNSLRLASVLEEKRAQNSGLDINLAGGYLFPNSGLLLGPSAAGNLSQYHADWAFLSAGGINANGVFNSNEMVVEIERVMINNADKVVILADHSKIGKHSMCQICGLEEIDILITDKWASAAPIIEEFRAANIQVMEILCAASE